MEAVVVFPCVPATARQRRVAQMAASISERGTTRMPRARASRSSVLSGCTAGENVTASAPATFSARCPTATVMPCERRRSATGESFRSEPETVWPMARSTSAIALMPAPPMPTTWMCRGNARSSASTPSPAPLLAPLLRAGPVSGHGRRPARRRGPPRRGGHGPGPPRSWRAAARGSDKSASSSWASRRPSHSGSGRCTAAPMPTKASALRVWWSRGAPGRGTRMAGTPATSSSATVMAPDLVTQTSAPP